MPHLSHRRAVATMIIAALLWSIAGVVTRQLDSARSFEVTFWRSFFNAVALVVLLAAWHGPGPLARTFRHGGRALWLSALCWCVMYTAFMVALTLTTVANVLVTMALAPLVTALLARALLGHRLAPRTWAAIAVAGLGIAWMYGTQFSTGDSRHVLGTVVALAVPLAAASNWTLLQHLNRPGTPARGERGERSAAGAAAHSSPASPARPDPGLDMLAAVLLGALLSAAITLPLAWPLVATPADLGWLGLLGVVQLAIPCLMAVVASRSLSAPEASLLSLLEVLFGVAWAWLGAGEAPAPSVLAGGALVLAALAGNEVPSLMRRRGRAVASA